MGNSFVRSGLRGALLMGLGLLLAGGSGARAGFVITAEAAGVQKTGVADVTTETFEGVLPGKSTSLNTAVGTVASPSIAVLSANIYGGAGGTGQYAAIGAQSGSTSATLTLDRAASFFGFWWSAADSQNQLDLLLGGKVVATFDAAAALKALGSGYDGNPITGQNTVEKYAYLNLFGVGGSTFDQVRFSNLSQGTGFESDNWSLRFAPPATTSGTAFNGLSYGGAIPEPSSVAMVATGLAGLGGLALRRRRARARG